jgi:iron complex transport system substrate-binding protein
VRIVSLLPSATEIVYRLGIGDQLVGVTFECDEPASARADHAIVVGGLDTAGLTPGEIDAQVRARVAEGVDLYQLDERRLRTLAPDLVITQDLCAVCALPSARLTDALPSLDVAAAVVTLDPHSLDDVVASVRLVGEAAGAAEAAGRLVGALTERLARVAEAVAGRSRPRVAVLEWVDPPFAAGHWVPDLVQAAGGESVLGVASGRSVATDWAALAAATPDVVVVAPCGFHLDAAAEQAAEVLDRLPPGVAVWAIDADGLVVRPGPRLVDGVEALAAALHPQALGPPPAAAVRRLR